MSLRSHGMRNWPFAALSVAVVFFSCTRTELAPGVNPEAIKSVRLGMSVEEVVQTLGHPLSVKALHGIHEGGCKVYYPRLERDVSNVQEALRLVDSTFRAKPCCKANRKDREERPFVLVYSRMVNDQGVSPMLWIHFDEQQHVREVYAKLNSRVPFRDDVCIYMLARQGAPDNADSTVGVLHDCKEDLLQEYFSQ